LGGEVVREVRCSHRVDAVAAHVRQMGTEGLNPILIMGASAIVDRGDVVPAAIVEVGGQLVHMGMPVDPGNLMLLARFGHIDVIGVPGCARSMKPSGYDWVLQRLAAGLSVGRRDIMRMGAGGLLNEIRARPLPRRDVDEQTAPAKIAAVVLAAGQSKRMGADNKLLADVQGVPMVVRVVRTLAESGVDRIIVVTGHESTQVAAQLRSVSGVELVHNPDYADGLSTSVRAGIRALDTDVDGALIALGDMPWVRSDHVRRLLDAFEPHGICVPVHDRKRGHPVLWSSRFFAEFEKLEGDVGARHLLERHADDVRLVPVDDRGVHIDVDTPQALAQLRDAWPGTTTE
ncbi:MAG: NTP transferase domain-containing protein, partial [Myxococcota bacterium]